MKNEIFTVISNKQISEDIYLVELDGDTSQVTACGQFVNILVDGCFLRRPISIFDMDEHTLTLLYKVVGHGTQKLSDMPQGSKLDVLVGLGNGFDLSVAGDKPLLIGGGIGLAPLHLAAKMLVESGCDVSVILGFRTKEEMYCTDLFADLGCNVAITTEDGSAGIKGFVTDAIGEQRRDAGSGEHRGDAGSGEHRGDAGSDEKRGDAGSGKQRGDAGSGEHRADAGSGKQFANFNSACSKTASTYSHIFTCGPEAMLKAVYHTTKSPAQFSFEERMGCGFGACMGCSCKTIAGYKRICKDGPVLFREEILWDC